MKQLHSRQFTIEENTYFFDVEKQSNDELMFSITQITKEEKGVERSKITLSGKAIDEFGFAFADCLCFLKENEKTKSYSVDEKRKGHAKAYMPWLPEDDEKLIKLFSLGKSTEELSKVFERNNGAINSRLSKLELI